MTLSVIDALGSGFPEAAGDILRSCKTLAIPRQRSMKQEAATS